MKEILLGGLYTLIAISSIIAFLLGVDEFLSTKKCNYYSIASYHPVRVVVCELFKERWKNE